MGMSNFLVFPAQCAKHGGLIVYGIPYMVLLIVVAIPLLTLELGLGQKFQNGNIWPKIHPKLAGLGYGQAFVAL